MTDDFSHRRAVILAVIVTVLWSSSWVIVRIGLDDEGLEPVTFAGLRYMTAAVILMAVVLARPAARHNLASLRRVDVGRLAALGVVFYTLTQGAQFVALDHQPAATTSLVLALTPLAVAAVAGRSTGERATAPQIGGAMLVTAGAIAYFSGSLGATAVGMAAAGIGLGSNVAGSILGRVVNRERHTMPLVTTAVSMAIGAALLVVTGLLVEGVPTLSGRALVIIAWLAVVNTALAFTLWNVSLRHLTATESALINNTMLVQIALLAWLFLDEAPSPIQVVGIVAVSAGVVWSRRRGGAQSFSREGDTR
jgi:drug/metabolite transporter (DMT)-like permease